MLEGNPYISANNATINAEKAPSDRQSRVVRWRVKFSPPSHPIGRIVIHNRSLTVGGGKDSQACLKIRHIRRLKRPHRHKSHQLSIKMDDGVPGSQPAMCRS